MNQKEKLEKQLIKAVKNDDLPLIQLFVLQGANIHAQNDGALRWASENGHLEIVQYFLFDCQMKIKQETKDWLIKNHQEEILNLVEKRDFLSKLDKNIIQKKFS